ncbi:hypothetical protein Tco_1193071 [Tanacetum coccineum]
MGKGKEGKVTKVNEGSSKRKLPPLGSTERHRPEVTPHVAKILKYGPCPPEFLTWYVYVDLDEYLEDTYFRSPKKRLRRILALMSSQSYPPRPSHDTKAVEVDVSTGTLFLELSLFLLS